ncbi:HAMP domain-containing sensor histidine kinase [Clostridium sp.]|uniref:sensor histidine kinase n=1 Tax=Clostridium sp. TaxID=1506 RepID=UPI00261F3353|nr:HAMP domain-containing sensor histidine kinase [Clostridium sp.]
MEIIKGKGIRAQLLKIIFIIIFSIIIILNILLIIFIKKYYYDNTEDLLNNKIDVSISLYEKYFPQNTLNEMVYDDIDVFWKDNNVQVEFFDKHGNLIMDSIGIRDEVFIKRSDVTKASKGEKARWIGKVSYNDNKVMAVSSPIIDNGEIVGIIRFITSLEGIEAIITSIIIRFSSISIVVLFIGIGISLILANSIIKPIKYITDVAEEMAGGNLKIRTNIENENEIGKLARTLNFMANEIEKRDQLKNEFISSISHELRTPLTAIKGWAITLNNEETDKETLELGFEIIEKEADRLSNMVEELLNFSSLISDKITLNNKKISVNKFIKSIEELMKPRALEENVELFIEVNTNLFIEVDINRLKQVFINLLDNSFKFIKDNRKVILKAEKIDKNIIFKVIDYGCGISEEDLLRVKEKFFKGKNSNSKNGIGLSICDEIIKLHKGEINIFSKEGIGTEVVISIPIAEEK